MISMDRRRFLGQAVAAAAVRGSAGAEGKRREDAKRAGASAAEDIVRVPDDIFARQGGDALVALGRAGSVWTAPGVSVRADATRAADGHVLPVDVTSSSDTLTHLQLRWRGRLDEHTVLRGDAWERSYGDLEWRGFVSQRVMPWYFVARDAKSVLGYGVLTQPGAFCFWQCDQEGISLWIDLRNGGEPTRFGGRELRACSIVMTKSRADEGVEAATKRFCERMCGTPRLVPFPIFGSNDWNYAYGKNTAEGILRDADLMVELAPAGRHRPFVVIDDGWQDRTRFKSLPEVASQIRRRGARPGIWVRPLLAPKDANKGWLLSSARLGKGAGDDTLAYDPSVPEGLDAAMRTIRDARAWGFEFVKHDFSSFDLMGRFGFEMGAEPARPGWSFADRSRTTAEIVSAFYGAIRREAGEKVVVLGCNTFGHLAARVFESQRIADDTSGRKWERTRIYGVNGLAHRIAQHRTFFYADPDIVAVTEDIRWESTRQWMDVVARSGTSLFFAPDPKALNPEVRSAMRRAMADVAESSGYPLDSTTSATPEDWVFSGPGEHRHRYSWSDPSGATPFPGT